MGLRPIRTFWIGVHAYPELVTERRDGEACIGNRKLEQETTEGTHA